jgi:integrase
VTKIALLAICSIKQTVEESKPMKTTVLRLVTDEPPTIDKLTVGNPGRKANAEYRGREYLTKEEVDALVAAAKKNRHGQRDALMIRMAFLHGLRASELVGLRWDQVNFDTANIFVKRKKGSLPSNQPIVADELRSLRALQRTAPASPFIFVSERGSPFTTAGFARLVERAGEAAEIGLKIHAHMLRHACGHVLANKGKDTRTLQLHLGHKNIQHTVRYTELAPDRLKNIWD